MTSETLLELKNIKVHYGGVKALDGASVAIDEGEIVALMGPNGAGKSTILKAVFGLAPIETGSVWWQGQPVRPVAHEMVARGLALVPQGRRVFKQLTVRENLEVGGYIIKDKKEIARRLEAVIELFPILRHKLEAKSDSLSGGQQQMLALARGLMTDPKVLLLDEPSLGLAPLIVKEVFEKIKEINERHQTSILVVEHNIKSLLKVVHRGYLLDKGQIVAEAPAGELIGSDLIEKVFMGRLNINSD